jgi:sodium transport system ATP-binding protein
MLAIEVENLSKTYLDKARGVVHAVDGISFGCSYGEIIGLLGPNGAGKTTTLRVLATVLKPTTGKARVAGYDVESESLEVRKSLGFLTGSTGLYGRLTPLETLRFFGKLHEIPESLLEERIRQMVTVFGMEEYQKSHCDRLSTGQKQRVNLARTLMHDPPVIILDEPTAGLDIISSKTIMEFIRNSKNHGKCILFSTHYLTEAEMLCDRVAIIHKGKILGCDTLGGLKEKSGCSSLVDVFFHFVEQHETQQN